MDNEEKRGNPAPSSRARGAVPNDSPSPRPSRALWLVVGLCLIVSMLSLALSAFMIYSLFSVRQTTVEGLDAAVAEATQRDPGMARSDQRVHIEVRKPGSGPGTRVRSQKGIR
jgi:hypothetical protein